MKAGLVPASHAHKSNVSFCAFQVMDAQELFMQLAPYLKEQTQKFVEEF
jgi:hypothetical protein